MNMLFKKKKRDAMPAYETGEGSEMSHITYIINIM